MIGKVIRKISNRYTLLAEDGRIIDDVLLAGKMRFNDKVILGDNVEYVINSDQAIIVDLLPRRNQLKRPKIANVDQALIMMSLKDPDFSYKLVDKLIVMIEYEEVEPVIIVSKTDLDPEGYKEIHDNYTKMGYLVIDHNYNQLNEELLALLRNKTSVICGQSGVGKSSLLNLLDSSLHLKTQEISKALNRGKHTTTHHELYFVKEALIADTPGFSSLYFRDMDIDYLSKSLRFLKDYYHDCRFDNCLHLDEPECAVKNAVYHQKITKTMYDDYCEIIKEIRGNRL
jgi:ribosome biogenesis GTPase